jgi:hypothetical protein
MALAPSSITRQYLRSSDIFVSNPAVSFLKEPFRLTNLVLSTLREYGIWLVEKTGRFAKKLYAILIVHSLSFMTVLFHWNVVCRVRNIAQQKVIWQELDIQKAQDFLRLLTDDKDYFSKKGLVPIDLKEVQVKETSLKGAITDGICFGASLVVIRDLLVMDVKTEKDLIRVIESYKYGFSAESAALQSMSEVFFKYRQGESPENHQTRVEALVSERNSFVKANLDKERDQLIKSEIDGLQFTQECERIESDYMEQLKGISVFERNLRLDFSYKNTLSRFALIASLIGLKIDQTALQREEMTFKGIRYQAQVRERFNQLPKGRYQVTLSTEHGGHAISYIKTDFGAYLLDPNFGLIKCDLHNPAVKLCELIKKWYPGKLLSDGTKEPFLQVFRYQLEKA